MREIWVTPLSRLTEVAERVRACRVVSLVTAGTVVERPAGVPAAGHLRLELSDISAPREGHILAAAAQVEALLAFADDWTAREDGPLLLHCYAGVSRSPAAAFALACHLRPEADEAALARELRRLSPSATPNPRLVALADERLRRDGRMVRAVEGMGRGAEAFEGAPFAWRVTER